MLFLHTKTDNMKKNIISLHGSYFGNNYGDILLVNLFARWIREACPNVIINMPKGKCSKANDLEYDTTGFINLFRSKALVFCGGGYFGEQPQNPKKWAIRNFLRHGIIGLFAIIFRIPFIIVGVEFGPISSLWFRKYCIWMAKHAKHLVVRNPESLLFVQNNGITNAKLSADAILALSTIIDPCETNKESCPIVLIHFNGIEKYSQNYTYFISKIAESARSCLGDFKLLFISDGPGYCYEAPYFKETFSHLKDLHIEYTILEYTNCNNLIQIINSASYVFTTKLHVGITAAALKKNVFSIWMHPKTPRLHNSIINGHNCIPFNDIQPEDLNNKLERFFSQDTFSIPKEIFSKALRNKQVVTNFIKLSK